MFLALVILEMLSGILYLYYTSLLLKIGVSFLHMYCRNLSTKYIPELCCNLAFSTFNTL